MASPQHAPNRDDVTTINADGSRFFLHPADVRGRFTLWRRIIAVGLIVFYAMLPWIPIGGFPAVFLDVRNLRFHFFGLTLAAQDLWLAFFLISGLGFGLFYVTALFGRIWCGWACPQTVFLEHVYRRIERLLEGDAFRRRRLDKSPWNAEKIVKRGGKHVLFVIVSLLITHIFLAYFVSVPQLWRMMTESPAQNWTVFVFIFVASGILYFNFAWFREQLCIIICPYGRLQSALIDDNSLVIGYDQKRGEPRGKKREEPGAESFGDCIDCSRCVQVCPTGIDIRQGLQMECIGCANCIDACDAVMAKIKRPAGLIRYDSLNGLSGQKTKFLRPRIYLYTALLLLGASVLAFSLRGFTKADASVLRMAGAPYYLDTRDVRNQFMLRVVNKTNRLATFKLTINVPAGQQFDASGFSDTMAVAPMNDDQQPLILTVPRAAYRGSFHFSVDVRSDDGRTAIRHELVFLGPSGPAAGESDEKSDE